MDLTEKIKEILVDELNLDSIGGDAKQENYAEWDSLTYMRIIAAIEDNFNIKITRENINNFNSVANIIKEVEKTNDHC